MAATEPNNPRDDGISVCDQLNCSSIREPHGLRQNDDHTSLRLLDIWRNGLRNWKSHEQLLLQLRSTSSFTVCAPEAGPSITPSFCGTVCVIWCSAVLRPSRSPSALRRQRPISMSRAGHRKLRDQPRAKAADSLAQSPCLPLSLRQPCVATGQPLPDLPVSRGSLVNVHGTQFESSRETYLRLAVSKHGTAANEDSACSFDRYVWASTLRKPVRSNPVRHES